MFGGDAKFNYKSNPTLLKAMEDNKDKIIVFLSDVWLDIDKVGVSKTYSFGTEI
jgi:hypothetical protein